MRKRQLRLRWIKPSLDKPFLNTSSEKWLGKLNFPKQRPPGDNEVAREAISKLGIVSPQFSFAQF